MDPVALYAQHFGKKVPENLVPSFLIFFAINWDWTKDLMISLRYAGCHIPFEEEGN